MDAADLSRPAIGNNRHPATMVRPSAAAAFAACMISLSQVEYFQSVSSFAASHSARNLNGGSGTQAAGTTPCRSSSSTSSSALHAGFGKPAGKRGSGNGGNNNKKKKGAAFLDAGIEKTYGRSASAPLDVTIDVEAAMNSFFSANEEFAPLFRCMATSASVPAMDFLAGNEPHGSPITFGPETPWKQLDAIPTGNEQAMTYVARFLDDVQRALVEIPVSDSKEADANDLHFIEEGRRMLRIGRFHVLPDIKAGCIDSHKTQFATCWSEIAELRRADEVDTGSVIILPDHDIDDLRRFIDMNVQRPLEWLGIAELFEVASLQRDSPAIRLLHKLEDIPDEPYQQE